MITRPAGRAALPTSFGGCLQCRYLGPLTSEALVTRLPCLALGPNLGDELQTLGGQGSEVWEVLVFAAFHPAGVCRLNQGQP